MSWQAEQHRDECVIQREISETLEKVRPFVTEDEWQLLIWAAGVREAFDREIFNQEAR